VSGLIVHEWLEQRGGAEKVVDAMRTAFPDADLLALWNDAPRKYPDAQETWLARTPLRGRKAAALPFLPGTWRRVRPYLHHAQHDWLLVSSHLFAHHVRPRGADRDIPKFVYAHTPARYIWTPELDQRGDSAAVRVAAACLKPLDRRRAQEAVKIAANSRFVRDRIRAAWQRDADVIYPPVDVERIRSVGDWRAQLGADDRRVLDGLPREFILGASRFVPYKRLDWVISAGTANDIPVVLAGAGPDEARLRALAAEATVPVHFVPRPSTELLYALYQSARAYVFPAIEDFGIMPVEAQAAGTVVVTTSIGGALESIEPGITGVSALDDTVGGICRAVGEALGLVGGDLNGQMRRFSEQRFVNEIRAWVVGG
jgi:glycosyltransferase involved in cell wall biosynthesis